MALLATHYSLLTTYYSPREARYPRCGAGTHAALAALDFDAINYELIVQLVAWLKTCPGAPPPSPHPNPRP